MKVPAVFCDEDRVSYADPGENVRVKLSGVEEEEILSGFVLCSVGMCIHHFIRSMVFILFVPCNNV